MFELVWCWLCRYLAVFLCLLSSAKRGHVKPAPPALRSPCYQERAGKLVDRYVYFPYANRELDHPFLKAIFWGKEGHFTLQSKKLRFNWGHWFPKFTPDEARVLIKPFSRAPTFPKRDPGINSYNFGGKLHLQINVGNAGINKATETRSPRLSKYLQATACSAEPQGQLACLAFLVLTEHGALSQGELFRKYAF